MKYVVSVNGKQFDVEVERGGVSPQPAQAPVSQPQAQPQIPVPQPVPQPQGPAAEGGTEVISPMPGNVHSISVTVGQSVNPGDCLLVIEAMKMENEIVAPQAGVVKQILVAKGATVDTNDVLVVLN